MAHRTITISEEAYNALFRLKKQNESFTDVIIRLASKGNAKALLDLVKKLPVSEDLALNIEVAMGRTRKASLRKVKLE